ncbi:TBC1 domain family member 13-like [Convolutriloba macropyga]|uniref:TBC1 domain family member 13-like n=1 Tax=Convolutriloba macropyga TaxID=536237 RepID=UPI003F526614
MGASPPLSRKAEYLLEELNKEYVEIENIREICFTGVPDDSYKRDVVWKILLNYLPARRADWPTVMKEKRQLYRDYMNLFIVQPGRKHRQNQVACGPEAEGECNQTSIADCTSDHPLSVDSNSEWQQYFTDNTELLQQIDKDCRRLFPDYSFFQKPTKYPASKYCTDGSGGGDEPVSEVGWGASYMTLRKRVEWGVFQEIKGSARNGISTHDSPERLVESYSLGEDAEVHWEVVERILFIYAKLNKATGYVQGMNELLGPIYHVFASSKCEETKRFAEADSFFCFVNLMAENRDIYTKSMDNSQDGIQGKFSQLNQALKTLEWDLYISLNHQQIHPQFYAFRWLSLLFAQEFNLPDIEQLWDTLFSDKDRFYYAIIVAVAMLSLEKKTILEANFNQTMHTVQHYQHSIDATLKHASVLHERYQNAVSKSNENSWSLSASNESREHRSTLNWLQQKFHSVKSAASGGLITTNGANSEPLSASNTSNRPPSDRKISANNR